MNTSTRTTTSTTASTTASTALRLLIAVPLAAGAIALGGGVAQAETPGVEPGPGPVIVLPGDDEPRPEGPGDIANPEEDPRPEGPGDITNPDEEDEPGPQVPGDKDGPNPGEGEEPEDGPVDVPADVPADEPKDDLDVANGGGLHPLDGRTDGAESVDSADVPVPNRIDAGAGPAADEPGTGLAWVLAGGGLLTAAGSVLARRRLAGVMR
ncbi:MAG TPA: hypothetical protein VNT31_10150 [Nocardioides sp.]|nr:hypothetical protein [Nocardioides sp.]